jgi:hypothetical protein
MQSDASQNLISNGRYSAYWRALPFSSTTKERDPQRFGQSSRRSTTARDKYGIATRLRGVFGGKETRGVSALRHPVEGDQFAPGVGLGEAAAQCLLVSCR